MPVSSTLPSVEADVGAHLTNHEAVDTIHITGSDKTYDEIVFGTGEEGRKRKSKQQPYQQPTYHR